MANYTAQQVALVRDGDRIASPVCGGYSDSVPDEKLVTYASDPSLHELDRAFADAVLAIRRYERLAVSSPVLLGV